MIRVLTGTNSYALRAALHQAVDAFAQEQGGGAADMSDMALERLHGEDASYERIQEALQSLPFLVPRKLVVLEAPGANKQFTEEASRLLAELPETTDLIIVEPKLDKRLSYYKLLKKQSGFQEYGELDERGLTNWLVETAREHGVRLSTADARLIVDRAGTSQQLLAGEIEKLTLYASGRAETSAAGQGGAAIDRAAIEALVPATPQSTIFQLLEAAFAGNTKRALQLYSEQRALRVEPQQIIAMLAWQLHVLALIKAAGVGGSSGRTTDQVAREAKISPYVVSKSAGIARTLTFARTRQLVSDLLTIDHRLKRESLDADDVLQEYLIGLAA